MFDEDVTPRELTDAPAVFSKDGIRDWLTERGARSIMSASAVATIIGVTARVIKNAESRQELSSIDKSTYPIESVVQWLYANPRYIRQNVRYWQVTEDTYPKVREILQRNYRRMIELWNNDVDELTAEVCYRMTKMPMSSPVKETTVIFRTINNLWHEKNTQTIARGISLNQLQEEGMQI